MTLFKIFDFITECIIDIAFPKHCIFCNKLVPAGKKLCVCNKCSYKVILQRATFADDDGGCNEVMSPLKYEDNVRLSMLKFKFKGVKYLGYTYAKAMADMIVGRKFYDDDCIITAVPIHRVRDRAYNQSEVIARIMCQLTNKKYCDNLIYKVKAIDRLSGMSNSDKVFYSKDSFYINSNYNVSGKTIIIVDDIYTSGTTLKELASQFRARGAKYVYGITATYRELQ